MPALLWKASNARSSFIRGSMSVAILVILCSIGAALGILIATGVIPLFREPPIIPKKKLIGNPPAQ